MRRFGHHPSARLQLRTSKTRTHQLPPPFADSRNPHDVQAFRTAPGRIRSLPHQSSSRPRKCERKKMYSHLGHSDPDNKHTTSHCLFFVVSQRKNRQFLQEKLTGKDRPNRKAGSRQNQKRSMMFRTSGFGAAKLLSLSDRPTTLHPKYCQTRTSTGHSTALAPPLFIFAFRNVTAERQASASVWRRRQCTCAAKYRYRGQCYYANVNDVGI